MTEYTRLRQLGYTALAAFHDSKVNDEFRALEDAGFVRLRLEPDYGVTFEDVAGVAFDRSENPNMRERTIARLEAEFRRRVDDEGIWRLLGEILIGGEWELIDDISGFVGDDWKDSGHAVTVREYVIAAHHQPMEIE